MMMMMMMVQHLDTTGYAQGRSYFTVWWVCCSTDIFIENPDLNYLLWKKPRDWTHSVQ